MPRRRVGVALLLPEPVATEVDALRRAAGATAAVERIPSHLTLVPPVNVRVEELDDAVAVLREAAASTRTFRLVVGPTATFLPLNPVVYLAVDGDVDAVHRLRDAVFVAPLARPLTWPFHPHVTVLDTGEPDHVVAVADALAGYRAEIAVTRVHLLEERRRSDGVRVWEPIADVGFGGAAVVGRGGLELDLEVTERPDPAVGRWVDRAWEADNRERYGDDWSPDVPVTVTARRRGDVVGVAEGHLRGSEAYLASLIVGADARGEGVGGHLLAAFGAAAVEGGCDRLTVRTEAGGPAERFYLDRGFEPVVELPAWRFGRSFVQLVRRL